MRKPQREDFWRRAVTGKYFAQQAYEDAMAEWRRKEAEDKGWQPGGTVDGEPARVKQEGDRTEALWGGGDADGGGYDHGHIVTNDGINAAFIRYPAEDAPAFDDPNDKRRRRR